MTAIDELLGLPAHPLVVHPGKSGCWLRPLLMILVALAGVGSLIGVIDAGHSGAKAVWEVEYVEE